MNFRQNYQSNKIRLGIFDDNENFLRAMDLAMRVDEKLEIVCKSTDGRQALDMILSTQPDVVLMDVIMPGMDGLEVLQQLSRLGSRVRSRYIILSAVGVESVVEEAFRLGASYFIKKPFDSHLLIRRIHQCYGDASGSRIAMLDMKQEEGHTVISPMSQEACVETMLHKIGISPTVKGYQYLKDAIMICVDNREVLSTITKVLYPTVATMNRTTGTRVERAIRHAIDAAWLRGSEEIVTKMFSYSSAGRKGRPTNSEFIALISDRVRAEVKYHEVD